MALIGPAVNCHYGTGYSGGGRGGAGGGGIGGGAGGFGTGAAIIPWDGQTGASSGGISGKTYNLDERLITTVGAALGVVGLRGVVSSGYRPITPGTRTDSAGSTSGRHQGFAMDVDIYNGDVLLNFSVKQHLVYLQEFIKQFCIAASGSGYTPGVGIGMTTNYMGKTRWHLDIARTLESGSWVNVHSDKPGANTWYSGAWVRQVLTDYGAGPGVDRTVGPSGTLSVAEVIKWSTFGKMAE